MPHPLDQLRLLTENEDQTISSTAKKALQYVAEREAGNLDDDE